MCAGRCEETFGALDSTGLFSQILADRRTISDTDIGSQPRLVV